MPVRGQAAAAHEGPACSMARVKGKKVERLQQEDQGSLQGGGCTEGGHSEGEEAVEGGCAVRGCTSAATRPAQGCTQGSRRHDRPDHMMVSCRGAKGMVACEYSVAEVVTDKYGRTWQKVSGDPTTGSAGGKRATKADKERAAMDRCYEVDIGDRVDIDTHDEGTVQGEVTHMLIMEGGGGVRQPGALEVRWMNETGSNRCGR